MYPIFLKEIRQFFSSLTGILAIIVFLLLMGLLLFVFPDTNLLDYGYATLDQFFNLAPFVLLLLVPAITMRSFADEFKSGTWELLVTKPIGLGKIILGKFLGALTVAVLAIIPTLIYVFTIKWLSVNGSVDIGAIVGSYLGLLFLVALFTAVGICCSAISTNSIVGFLAAALGCYLLFSGFDAVSRIPALAGTYDYYIQMLGADSHYRGMSKGVFQLNDALYFAIATVFFLLLTQRIIIRKTN